MKKVRLHKCEKCLNDFKATRVTQIYCGSKTHKTGCSYLNSLEKSKLRKQKPESRIRDRAYSKRQYEENKESYYQPYYKKKYKLSVERLNK
jgi:hypothetical protein